MDISICRNHISSIQKSRIGKGFDWYKSSLFPNTFRSRLSTEGAVCGQSAVAGK